MKELVEMQGFIAGVTNADTSKYFFIFSSVFLFFYFDVVLVIQRELCFGSNHIFCGLASPGYMPYLEKSIRILWLYFIV